MILYQVVKNQMNRMFRSGAVANIGQVPWSRRLERPNLIPSYKPTPTLPSASAVVASWSWGCRETGDTGLCGRGPSQHSWSLCQELQLHPHSYRILEGLINYHGTETCTQWKIEYHSFTWYLLCKEELGLWLVSSNPFRIESGRQSNVGQFQFKGIHK